ncbi:relaxase/mobilization nuclease domain-containing protein [bacterium]|nr:relaxase/mobilization nuclease domain-containing protein [bacterium]
MIPVITNGGTSFRGVFRYLYYARESREECRVAWSETRNMMTACLKKAWKVMAFTVKVQDRLKEASGGRRSGRKLEKPVFSYSLSWHPEQKPTKERMLEAVSRSLLALGLEEHEAMIIAHGDRPHPHVHIVANRVHPVTGIAAPLHHSKRKLSEFAHQWEQEDGKIYCRQREENFQKRKQGKKGRYRDPVIASAWEKSSSGLEFASLLREQGYQLVRGRRCIVVRDPWGKTINPLRHLRGLTYEQFEGIVAEELSSEGSPKCEEVSENDSLVCDQENKMRPGVTVLAGRWPDGPRSREGPELGL